MPSRLHSRLTFANVCSFLALLIALGTGSAYAANTVFSTDIVDGEVKTADLDNNAVRTTKIANGQVANADLHADAVDGSKIADGSVTGPDIGFGQIDGSKIGNESITTDDIRGTDIRGGVSFTVDAGSCERLDLIVSGANVGDFPLFSFTGSAAINAHLQVTPLSVTSANTVRINACNLGTSPIDVSNAPVRVITFG